MARALAKAPTPFYLCSTAPLREALREARALGPKAADGATAGRPAVRHWLSCKTQPVRPLLRWWRQQGLGVEVVSEYELLAARAEGYPPERILVNGPAKHHWLPRHPWRGLSVNFDSLRELAALLPAARTLNWRVGVRCHTHQEHDPDQPREPTQFGLLPAEAVTALRRLQRAGLRLETVHFHLRTNVASPTIYARAMAEVAAICRAADFHPLYLDCGGGVPPHAVRTHAGRRVDGEFDLGALARVYARAARLFPGLREVWLENGRFISARSGVLVVRVLEVKERGPVRQLICDGGRTTQALVSVWEAHELFSLPSRGGPLVPTTVCGPTCMAFDQLARRRLPRTLRAGDYLVWLDAGAYHLPWETRFSHGYAAVVWHEHGRLTLAREHEPFAAWWGQWKRGR